MCDQPVRYAIDKQVELCKRYTCNIYHDHTCKCESLIERSPVDPLVVCTSYRCIESECAECGSDIRPYDDYEGMCSLTDGCITKRLMIEKSINQLSIILGIDKDAKFNCRSIDQKIIMIKSLIIDRLNTLSRDDMSMIGLLMAAL